MKRWITLLSLAVLLFAGCSDRAAIQDLLASHPVEPEPAGLSSPPPQLLAVEPIAREEEALIPEEAEEVEPPEAGYNTPSNGEGRRARLNIDMRGARMVALTFDDGPSAIYTNHILDILEQHGGRATFFVLGYRVAGHADTIRRTVQLGSEVAGHSWDHPDLSLMSDEADIAGEIERTSAAIRAITGTPPPIYRPPFGRTNDLAEQVSARLGYAIINWTLDPRDWEHRDADKVFELIMNDVESGDIIVLHDVHPSTALAMERVVPALIAEGFELVTVSELLTHAFGELEPGVIYGRNYNTG